MKNVINETTKRKIGKITYEVVATESETAKDTLFEKIEKLLIKGITTSGIKED